MTIDEVRDDLEKRFVLRAAMNGTFGLTSADRDKPFAQMFGRTSVVAVLLYAVAAAIWAKDRLLSAWLKEVEQTAEATRYGTYRWWVKAAKEFQDGDTTEVIDGAVRYAEIDETKRIVKAATVVQDGRNLTIKVAKAQGDSLAPLSAQELQRFRGYVQNIKPIGIVCNAVSGEAASVELVARVVYNIERSAQEMEAEVKSAVNDYLGNIGFGGTVFRSRVLEAIMGVAGVVDASIMRLKMDGANIDIAGIPAYGYAKLTSATLNIIVSYDQGR